MARKQDGGSNGCIMTGISRLETGSVYTLLSTYPSFPKAALVNKNVYIARNQRQGSKAISSPLFLRPASKKQLVLSTGGNSAILDNISNVFEQKQVSPVPSWTRVARLLLNMLCVRTEVRTHPSTHTFFSFLFQSG